MTWAYSAGVLTSTGATEASPDSLLAGIAIVQAADATRAYHNGFIAWLNNVQIIYVNSFVIVDDDSTTELRGTTFFASGGAVGLILGNRSTLIVATSSSPGVGLTTTNVGFPSGSTIIARRQNLNDPSPRIIYRNTARHDFPSVPNNAQVLAKVAIAGLDLYDVNLSAFNFFRLFFANATLSSVRAIRSFVTSTGGTIFPNGNNIFLRAGTYEDLYQERVSIGTEVADGSTTILLRPTYYSPTPQPLSGLIRDGTFVLTNPSFLNNCWNGAVFFQYSNFSAETGGLPGATSRLTTQYTMQQTFRQGLTALSGVRVRYTRARASVTGTPTWTAPNSVVTATSDASGSFPAVSLVDTYREGTSQTNVERFNWTCKARRYDRRSAGETVFASRVLYQASVNQSLGYNEEVQMLAVPLLSLTESQAAALTNIEMSASGATTGTLMLSNSRTVAEVWQYYRQWIAQIENFDSSDTWNFDGTTLDVGGWNVTLTSQATLTGSITTTGTISNSGTISGVYGDANGSRVNIRSADGLALTTRVHISGVDQGFVVESTTREIVVGPTSNVRVYAHAYGYQPKIINVVGNNAANYVVSLIPEPNVDTTLSTTIRDEIVASFSSGNYSGGRFFLSVNADLRQYTPAQVMNALHRYIVVSGGSIAWKSLDDNSVEWFSLIRGGMVIRSSTFFCKIDDSVTTVSNLGVLLPLVINVDADVYNAMPTYTPVLKNSSDLVLQYAPWTQQEADVPTWVAAESTVKEAAAKQLTTAKFLALK